MRRVERYVEQILSAQDQGVLTKPLLKLSKVNLLLTKL
jgi:hypothetical protein